MIKTGHFYRAIKGRGKVDRAYRLDDEVKFIKIKEVHPDGSLLYDLYEETQSVPLYLDRSRFSVSDIDTYDFGVNVSDEVPSFSNSVGRLFEMKDFLRQGSVLVNNSDKKKTMFRKVSSLIAATLSPDLRVLIKAGILNPDLTIADHNFVLEAYVASNTKELADRARKVLKAKTQEE